MKKIIPFNEIIDLIDEIDRRDIDINPKKCRRKNVKLTYNKYYNKLNFYSFNIK